MIPDSRALWLYLITFGGLLASGMGVPLPEELWVVWAGASSRHPPDDIVVMWWIMLPACILGVVLGDSFLYAVGWFWGHRLLNRKWVQRWVLRPERRVRIQRNFDRYGVWILLAARLLPGLRSPIFLLAGTNRMPVVKFVVADGVYAIPGVSMMFFLAYAFTDQFVEIVQKAEKVRPISIVIVITAVAVYLVHYFCKHPVAEGDPKELPIIGEQIASHIKHPEKPVEEKKAIDNAANK